MQLLTPRTAVMAVAGAVLAALLLPLVPAGPAGAAVTPVELACVAVVDEVEHEADPEEYAVDVQAPGTVENGATLPIQLELDRLPRTPVPVTGLTVQTTVTLSLELDADGAEEVDDTADASTPPVDLDADDPLPGPREFSFAPQVHSTVADAELSVVLVSVVVEYLTADDDLAGTVVECTPTGDAVVDTVVVAGESAECEPDCEGEQTFVGDPPEDALVMWSGPQVGDWESAFVFDADESALSGWVASDTEKLVRVSDRRGVAEGWTLTATLDAPLVNGAGQELDASALRLHDVDCRQTPGAAGSAPVTDRSGGTLDETVVLCTLSPSAVGNTGAPGGQWDVAATLTLEVPALAGAGIYTGAIVLNLA